VQSDRCAKQAKILIRNADVPYKDGVRMGLEALQAVHFKLLEIDGRPGAAFSGAGGCAGRCAAERPAPPAPRAVGASI
jgi:hypothetical protein